MRDALIYLRFIVAVVLSAKLQRSPLGFRGVWGTWMFGKEILIMTCCETQLRAVQ